MLTVIVPPALDERRAYHSFKASGDGTSYYICIQGYRPERIPWSRMASEFLRQGKNFDKFKNREVENFQNEGILIPLSPEGVGLGPSHQPGKRMYDRNPNIQIGANWYTVLNFLPVANMPSNAVRQKKYYKCLISVRGCYPGLTYDGVVSLSLDVRLYYEDDDKLTSTLSLTYGSFASTEAHDQTRDDCIQWLYDHWQRPFVEYTDDATDVANRVFESLKTVLDPWFTFCVNRLRRDELFGKLTMTQMSSYRSFHIDSVDPMASINEFFELSKYLSFFAPEVSIASDEEMSQLGKRVVEKINDFSSNLIAYFSEFSSTGDTIRELLSLPRNLKNPKKWASAWLSYRFGDRLAIQDTEELLSSLQRKFSKRQSMAIGRSSLSVSETDLSFYREDFDVTQEIVSTLIVANDSYNGIMTAIKKLMTWDAWPTLENTWDMIPLSFVVDWILPVSDILSDIDTWVEKAYLKPLSGYISRKTIFRPKGKHLWAGDPYFKCYVRKSYNILNDILPFTLHDITPAFSLTHLGDAIALGRQFKR